MILRGTSPRPLLTSCDLLEYRRQQPTGELSHTSSYIFHVQRAFTGFPEYKH